MPTTHRVHQASATSRPAWLPCRDVYEGAVLVRCAVTLRGCGDPGLPLFIVALAPYRPPQSLHVRLLVTVLLTSLIRIMPQSLFLACLDSLRST